MTPETMLYSKIAAYIASSGSTDRVRVCQSVKASRGDVQAIVDRLSAEGAISIVPKDGVGQEYAWTGKVPAPVVRCEDIHKVTGSSPGSAQRVPKAKKRKYVRKAVPKAAPEKKTAAASSPDYCPRMNRLAKLAPLVKNLARNHTVVETSGVVVVQLADLKAFFEAWDMT